MTRARAARTWGSFPGRLGLLVFQGATIAAVLLLGACQGRDDRAVRSTGVPTPNGESARVPLPPDDSPGPAPEDGEGSVRILPGDPVVAGSLGRWVVEWVAGPAGLPAGGGAVLQISPFWGWSPPQVRRPGSPGYTTAACSNADVGFDLGEGEVPMTVVARITAGAMTDGDTLRFVYGDSLGSGPGSLSRADIYAEDFEELLIKTDGNGDGWFAAVADQPTLEIRPGPAVRLAVATPTVVDPGESFEVRVHGLDRAGNRTALPQGDLRLVLRSLVAPREGPAASPDTVAALEAGDGVSAGVTRLSIPRDGLYRVEASLTAGERRLAGRNDLLLVEADSPFREILWGDIHSHSALSDGTGAPADLLAFARDVAGLDVAAVTDHDAHGLFPLAERGGWDAIRSATREAYRPGEFVTLLGYEWTSWTWGHRNVYYPDDEGEVFAFLSPDSDTPEELWAKVAPWSGLTIPHHPGGGPVAVDWSVPSDEERERIVEICSIHGSSEVLGAERGIYRPVPGAFVRDALNLGHRLAILAAGDTHDGHPGLRTHGALTNGLAAFRASARTREAVWNAMRERRVYGTSGPRILLATDWGGEVPGTELEEVPEGPLVVAVVAPEPVEVVELIGPSGTVASFFGGGRRVVRRFEGAGEADPGTWLYVRVVLADGEVAWESPYWLPGAAS